jgi:uncharacterized protein YutE (UPF0331/DUF86 family)
MTIAEMETTRLESLASEYRAKGYEVHVHPDRSHLPSFLVGFSPDMIALSPQDKVVIQIKTAQAFDPEQVQKLAEFVEGQPLWRYEVALVNLPAAPDVPAEEELAAEDQVTQLIANAELLADQNQIEAAALLAWSAVEAILRRRARSDAPELERQSSARVLKHLYSLGRIQRDLYETLSRLMEFRNAVAHGFAPRVNAPSLPQVITDIRRLRTAA